MLYIGLVKVKESKAVRRLTRREQVRCRLVYDDGHWHMYADVVVHGLDFPSAFTHHWVCMSCRVEAQEQMATISFL